MLEFLVGLIMGSTLLKKKYPMSGVSRCHMMFSVRKDQRGEGRGKAFTLDKGLEKSWWERPAFMPQVNRIEKGSGGKGAPLECRKTRKMHPGGVASALAEMQFVLGGHPVKTRKGRQSQNRSCRSYQNSDGWLLTEVKKCSCLVEEVPAPRGARSWRFATGRGLFHLRKWELPKKEKAAKGKRRAHPSPRMGGVG